MDYPKLENETMTVRLNPIALHCVDAIADKDEIISRAIEYYFASLASDIYTQALHKHIKTLYGWEN